MAEKCWFIYGVQTNQSFRGLLVYHSMGSETSVDFSYKKAMNPFVIGWLHTHPEGFCDTSEEDNKTMRSWVKGLNKPRICGIMTSDCQVWYRYARTPSRRVYRVALEVRPILGSLIHGWVKGSPEKL